MIKTLKPNLTVQETAQETFEVQLLSYICLSLPSPRTFNAEAMTNPVPRGVCINKTPAGLKALQEAYSHHCFTSLFEGLFLFCSLPQQLYSERGINIL